MEKPSKFCENWMNDYSIAIKRNHKRTQLRKFLHKRLLHDVKRVLKRRFYFTSAIVPTAWHVSPRPWGPILEVLIPFFSGSSNFSFSLWFRKRCQVWKKMKWFFVLFVGFSQVTRLRARWLLPASASENLELLLIIKKKNRGEYLVVRRRV